MAKKKWWIAIHVLDDFCLPLQEGTPGTKEREESNREIEDILERDGCDFSDMVDAAYFIPYEWVEKDVVIAFKNTEGNWENVKKRKRGRRF